ncbi:MAG: hemerythrin domain-containing protein [Candidatus Omnitrophota bacterium]|nr:hemerythrin domain-containing protein [Candidatus Omnitrophota bacterium]MDZ4242891.1 hemerythrin domain-containing protein [Candidatus Omnitrophota bacterium]
MSDTHEAFHLLRAAHEEISDELRKFETTLVNLRYEGRSSDGRNEAAMKEVLDFFKETMVPHIDDDERAFDFLEKHIPRLSPLIGLLRKDHQEFRERIAELGIFWAELHQENVLSRRLERVERLMKQGTFLICCMRHHLRAEYEKIYLALDTELKPLERETLFQGLKRL